MTELMIKMTFWLVGAMALGFWVAWLLSRTIHAKKESDSEKNFSALILEQKNMIDKLEKDFRHKKIGFEELSENLAQSQEALAGKISLLTTLQHKLDKGNNFQSKENNNLLFKQIQELEEADKKRVKELDGFGEIVLLAEEKLEENEKKYKHELKDLNKDIESLKVENKKHKEEMKAYLKTITELKESLTLYEAYSSEPEFIISRDQFVQIEKQLTSYQKEIESLKSTNEKSLLKSQAESF